VIERWNKCKGILHPVDDQHALEVGTGYCDSCGHEELASELNRLQGVAEDCADELARMSTLATAIAKLAGFDSINTAHEYLKARGDRWSATESRSGGNGNALIG